MAPAPANSTDTNDSSNAAAHHRRSASIARDSPGPAHTHRLAHHPAPLPPVMSFTYGAPSISGIHDVSRGQHSPPRRTRAGSSSTAAGPLNTRMSDGHRHQGDDGRSDAAASSSSRRLHHPHPGAWNGSTSSPGADASIASRASAQEPASVRYARLRQRLKDTGSSRPPPTDTNNADEDGNDVVSSDEDYDEGEEAKAGQDADADADADAGVQREQRGNGTGVIQHSEHPKQGAYKDTSVNIATAFWQAAGGRTSSSSSHAQAGLLKGVLGEERDVPLGPEGIMPGALNHDTSVDVDVDNGGDLSTESEYSLHTTTMATTGQLQQSRAPKKRKKPPSSSSAARAKQGDGGAYRPSKAELTARSSDDDDSVSGDDDGPVDLRELEFDMGYGPKRESVKYATAGGSLARKTKPRKKARKGSAHAHGGEEDKENEPTEEEEDEEDQSAELGQDGEGSMSTGKKASSGISSRRRRKKDSDGVYKPGQNGTDDDDEGAYEYDDAGRKTRRPASRQSKGKNRALEQEAGGGRSHLDRDQDSREPSEAPSNTGTNLTSYYLQEPDNDHPNANANHGDGKRLTQILPKSSGTSYQPYFAFSTTIAAPGNGNANGNRNREPSVSSTASTQQYHHSQNAGEGDRSRLSGKQPSSNASFDARGSEYDYSEEERMLAQLEKAKLRAGGIAGSSTHGLAHGPSATIPEGRPFSKLLPGRSTADHGMSAGTRAGQTGFGFERDLSLDPSEQSQDSSAPLRPPSLAAPLPSGGSASQQQQSKRLAPRRGPPPPDRERDSSVLSESSTTQPDNSQRQERSTSLQEKGERSIGLRLGEVVRKLLVLLYWLTVGPYKFLRGKDGNTLWKWAAGTALLALMLTSMHERAASQPPHSRHETRSGWHMPFLSSPSSHSPTYTVPSAPPSNLDELIARLTTLEGSLSSLSHSQASDHTHMFDTARGTSELSKRLSALEAEFESERRRAHRALESGRKDSAGLGERVDGEVKGVKSQLDHLAKEVKTLSQQRKRDAADATRLSKDHAGVERDVSSLSEKLVQLQKAIEARYDSQGGVDASEVAKMVNRAVEDILPARMAVSVDQKTGQVHVDPKFWQHLKSSLASEAGGKGVSGVDRTGFLAANQKSLESLVSDKMDERVSEGAVLSRKAFTELIERELHSLRAEMSQSTADRLSKLSSEFDNKLTEASLSGKASSTGTIKLSSGEDVRTIVGELIDRALAQYSKDVLARPDYALSSSGGRVIPSLTSPTYSLRPSTWTGAALSKLTGIGSITGRPPVTALHPDTAVGQCWPFAGQSGQLGILLSRRIVPDEIVVEHASKDVALDVSSAPSEFEAWGLVEDQESLDRLARLQASSEEILVDEQALPQIEGNRVLLVKGRYEVDAESHIQTFPVDKAVHELGIPLNVVVFRILSNHGNPALSCLYRVRVGGKLAEVVAEETDLAEP